MRRPIPTISPLEAAHRLHQPAGLALVDVRTPLEFSTEHAYGAINLPLDQLDESALAGAVRSDSPVAFICQSGARASKACSRLADARPGTTAIQGGTVAWMQAGLPVVRRAGSVSLERQVRATAGALVIFGTLLGMLVHPAWLAVTLFVGSGLVFSGITNTCGLGLLLTRCPWNHSIQKGASRE